MWTRGRTMPLAATVLVVAVCQADVVRVFRPERFSRGVANVEAVQPIDEASWLWHPDGVAESREGEAYLRFRRDFVSPGGVARIDMSADERFVLMLDGVVLARGPARGDVENWQYATYDVAVAAGRHVLDTVVWKLGDSAPSAQLTWRGGFILKAGGAFDAELTTGKSDWRVGRLTGTRTARELQTTPVWGMGVPFEVSGTGLLDELPAVWAKANVVRTPIPRTDPLECGAYGRRTPGWILYPSQLRDQIEVERRPGKIRLPEEGAPCMQRHFAAKSKTVLLWDLEDYYCAYPKLVTQGGRGARISWTWEEAMRNPVTRLKTHNRSEWKGLLHEGFGDVFHPDGRRNAVFTTPWFRCGRWVKVVIETDEEPLDIVDMSIVETRYPLEDQSTFECDDGEIGGVRRLCVRGEQMCAHEILFDCPYYEQQMYPGDMRVQADVLRTMGGDDALIRRAIEIFDFARRDNGMVPMNAPSRRLQESATYTLCHLLACADYARYGASREWLKARLPGLRQAIAGVELCEDGDGLVSDLPGWNFMDWVPAWRNGVSPDGFGPRCGALNNLLWTLARQGMAFVERTLGNRDEAEIQDRKARKTFGSVERLFWDVERGLYSDTVDHTRWSEHAQCLAVLTGFVSPGQSMRILEGLVRDPELAKCSVYFSYYLFETYFKFGRGDLVLRRLDLWRDYVRQGLRTPLEHPDGIGVEEEPRSDCHAWGAHPLVAFQRGFAGVRSAGPFGSAVRIAPCPGPLKFIRAKIPWRKKQIAVDYSFDKTNVTGTVTLPEGVSGTFEWRNRTRNLHPGVNAL